MRLLKPWCFSAYAVRVAADVDPQLTEPQQRDMKGHRDAARILPPGIHLRMLPTSSIGFPLAPWLVWDHLASERSAIVGNFVWDGAADDFNLRLDANRPIHGRLVKRVDDKHVLVAVEARPVGDGEVTRITILAPDTGRETSARSEFPFRVAAPDVRALRVEGRGKVQLIGWVVHESVSELLNMPPSAVLGLPRFAQIPRASYAWYAPDDGQEDPMKRVERGAPLRPSPIDAPEGPFNARGAQAGAAERARVEELRPSLEGNFAAFVASAQPPAEGSVLATRGKRGAARNPMRSLLLQSIDPGAARYLALLTNYPPRTRTEDQYPREGPRPCCYVAGLFAATGREALGPPTPEETAVVDRIVAMHDPRIGLKALVDGVRSKGVDVRAVFAVAFVAPPPDPPRLTEILLEQPHWRRAPNGEPGNTFSQLFTLPSAAVAPLVALARKDGAGWASRNPLNSTSATRRAPVLLGTPAPGASGGLKTTPPHSVVFDKDIPATGADYRIALGDLFGRFGKPCGVRVDAPVRPDIPAPKVQAALNLAPVPAHRNAYVPGTAEVTVIVPAYADLVAGSIALAKVRVEGPGGAAQVKPAPQGGNNGLRFSVPLPTVEPFPSPKRTHLVAIDVLYEDANGRKGPATRTELAVVDPRPPALPPHKAKGILWTSLPGPSQDVEVGLRFAAEPGSHWKVYVADANVFKAGTGAEAATPLGELFESRAALADAFATRAKALRNSREKFRLLLPDPVDADASGTVVVRARLPRALQTVQFVRMVPVNAEGVEADFDACPIVPVAVPSDARPTPPRIEVRADEDGAVKLAVVSSGIDAERLKRSEPGLFTTPRAASANAPRFRLRRATGAVADPVYARLLPTGAGRAMEPGTMAWNAQAGRFEGSFVDEEAKSYGRYFYWADMALPAERRVKRGVQEAQRAIEPAMSNGSQLRDAEGFFSDSSPAVMVVPVPPQVPALQAAQVDCRFKTVGAGWQLDFAVVDGPKVPERAVGAFRVRVHIQADAGALNYWKELELEAGAASDSVVFAGAAPASVRVAAIVVDPVDRTGPLRFFNASP